MSSVVQVISKIIDHNYSIEDAVNSPRFSDNIVGTVNSVMYTDDGKLAGAADPRKDGLAIGS